MSTENKKRYFVDTETVGLYGMIVLIQHAVEDGPIQLTHVWKQPASKTLALIEEIADNAIVGFNLTFDWFHLCKLHTVLSLIPGNWIPEQHIETIAKLETAARDGHCLKPWSALDLFLHSRKGPQQMLMERSPVRIKRVPVNPVKHNGVEMPLCYAVKHHLDEQLDFDPLLFARKKDGKPEWTVQDRTNRDGKIDTKSKDVILRFAPSGGLKALAKLCLKNEVRHGWEDVSMTAQDYPAELGYAPTALAVTPRGAAQNWTTERGKKAWPALVERHIKHWYTNEGAQEYAYDDIVHTRDLWHHYGCPEHGDVDSVLACMVAAVRWHGFILDKPGLGELKKMAQATCDASPINTNAPKEVRRYMTEVLDDEEAKIIAESTKKARLIEMRGWEILEDDACTKCLGGLLDDEYCHRCGNTGEVKVGPHPASLRAKELVSIKEAYKELELYLKLAEGERFHASFKIIGTKSSRMSGADGLNPQGIKNDPLVRAKFPLAWDGMVLCGGDFDAFEVAIADGIYNDPDLRDALKSGQKIHGLFGMALYPKYSYDQIIDSKDNPQDYEEGDMYSRSKSGVFAMLYGGQPITLNKNLGIPIEVCEAAFVRWGEMFPGIAQAQERINTAFMPLIQPGGIKTAITWTDPEDSVGSLTGFRRFFTLENKIIKDIYEVAMSAPQSWKSGRGNDTLVRSQTRGEQTAFGATMSALYGCAFQMAEANIRAATNHEIQCTGGEITKSLQADIWDLQPHGASPWRVAPMNVHDEVMVVADPEWVPALTETVKQGVEKFRDIVPLIGMSWVNGMADWSGKKGDKNAEEVNITWKDQTNEQ